MALKTGESGATSGWYWLVIFGLKSSQVVGRVGKPLV